MSSTNALETNEELENVCLVRMEDVQPSRRKDSVDKYESDEPNECIINEDDDSNIGSMLSVHSEEVIEIERTDINSQESSDNADQDILENKTTILTTSPDSWPTLEILPGGVIKNADKIEEDLVTNEINNKALMYACAICSEKFEFLFCLVKHVKWHEDQKKIETLRLGNLSKIRKCSLHSPAKNKRKRISKKLQKPKRL